MQIIKNSQTGRSLLTECGADEPIFLSNMYKQNTRSKKYQSAVLQYGRSMVEMLGVLAIIGVLSVGAITGYSKAMMKYKLNRHLLTMNELVNTVAQYIGQISGNVVDTDTIYYSETFYKAGFAPDDIILKNDSVNLYDSFYNKIWLFYYPDSKLSGMGYELSNDSLGKKICINLVNIAKEHSSDLYYLYSTQINVETNEGIANNRYDGDNYCNGIRCIKNITISDIDNLCNSCTREHRNCRVYLMWKY